MPQQSTLWTCWRICSSIAVASLWLLVRSITHQGTTYNSLPTGFLINTSGCRIPDLDPFDPSIKEFIYEEEDTKCEETYGIALVESDSTTLYINEIALPYYKITDVQHLKCCFTPFWRVEVQKALNGKYPDDVDSQIRFGNTCTQFTKEVKVNDEFVRVQCFLHSIQKRHIIYTDFHAFAPNKNVPNRQEDDKLSKKSVSVMIVGVDSVSRLNLHRQMPLTLNFLKTNLSAIEFLGYNKVEDNTFLNVMPILTGLHEGELKRSCWPRKNNVFDDCRFVWDQYAAAGYTTAFTEDAHLEGGIFSNLVPGFRKQPTDYYTRPFYLQAQDIIGFSNRKSFSDLCLGPRKSLKVLLDYAFKFSNTMKNLLSFIFVWGSSLTHDYINLAKRGDVDHKEFLEKLYRKEIFNRTVMVFTSDHGIRSGEIRQTYQGYFEERLPFLFIAYPDWFSQKFTTAVDNLITNAKRLTTPFDLHETLQDLVDLNRLENDVLRIRSNELVNNHRLPRGISLFLPIPGKRSCKDADIVDHWCTCHQSVSVPTNDVRVKRAANYLVRHINSLVKDYPRCARLRLKNITNAREEKATSHKIFTTSDGGLTDYLLTIETIPGEALFESTIRFNERNYTIIGTVSRINLYGNQSSCISEYRLLLYCYCN